MIGTIAARTRTTLGVAREAIGQRRVPYLPDEDRHRMRDARVRAIVRHAAETVPHYRDAFREAGIEAADVRTADDLEHLPLVDRATVQADPDRFVSRAPSARDALRFPTNGTTGTPLAVFHNRASVLANIAWGERERVVETHFAGRPLRYVVLDVNYGPRDTGFQILRFYREATAIPVRPARHMLRITDAFDVVCDAIDRLRPHVLQGYGSYLEAFFEELDRSGRDIRLPRLVLYGSDTMSPAGRRFVEERFGVPVISRYNAVEALKIGFVCEQRSGVHLEDDLCHVRLLDAQGRPRPPGAVGEVVISNLVNHATVLLNYRLGDVAASRAEACPCGRTTPMLADVAGRLERTLRLRDGGFVPEGAVQVTLKDLGAESFQLVEHAGSRYELKVLTASPTEYERIRPALVGALRRLLGEHVVVEPSHHTSLPPGPRGVFQYVQPLSAAADGARS